MSGFSTAVPPVTFGAAGFIAPAESDVVAGVIVDMNAAFGARFNPALTTPQGQLASSESAAIGDQNAVFLFLSSQTDPAYAIGRMQDAIGRIYFMTRFPARSTVVSCTVSGNNGVVLPVGALAQDVLGNIYSLVSMVTFTTISPTQTAAFTNNATGPIPCPAGSLATIYQNISGWNSIVNPADGILGTNVETRQEFETRRQQSVALNSRGPIAAIQAAVLAAPGVLDAYTVQNNTTSARVVGGVSIAANSIYVSTAGGTAQNIGNAIYSKAPPGIPTVGTSSVTITDTQTGLVTPYPTYVINYTVATSTPIYVQVTLANTVSIPSNATTLIQAAVLAAFTGADGGSRARIGSTIYASRFYTGVAALGAWAQIIDIYVGTAPNPTANSVTMNADQAPTTSAPDITVVLV